MGVTLIITTITITMKTEKRKQLLPEFSVVRLWVNSMDINLWGPGEVKRDYQITFLTEFLVLVSQIVVFKLAANFLGNQGFGEYALARRTISFAIPVLLLGMGVGLTRYLAFASVDSSKSENSHPYFVCAFLIVTTAVSLFLLALNLLAREGAYIFFGDKGYHFLFFPLGFSF